MAMTVTKTSAMLLHICLVFYMTFTLEAARSWGKNSDRNYDDLSTRSARSRKHQEDNYYGPYMRATAAKRHKKSDQPNIILIITDDQDDMLGSMLTMRQTLKIMGQEGIRFNNSFVATPMCCPSRSSLLTGMYPHNHHVYSNNANCSGPEWQRTHEPRTFAKYLSDAGYRTGFFGKYLNEYNGTYVPPGWREWVGLVKNSRFYNYTLNFNGQKVKHDDNYFRDYFTDLIANDSVTFMKMSKQHFPDKPVMMMLSVPAPHGREDSAPQFQHMFENNTLHRTPSWNYNNNSDKQWLVKEMKPLDPIGMKFTDLLQQKRLQTLQSVDSLVEKVHYTLRYLGELDNTYIIYTSDHGYHLGQYGIIKGKALPYDFDTRVPLFIRGPGVLKDTKIPNIVGNIDIAPTILDMAGIEIPEHMDGQSLLKLIKNHKQENNLNGEFVKTRRPWRDTFLIERGKVNNKVMKDIERENDNKIFEDHTNEILPYANPTLRRTLKICMDPNNQPPCKMNQKWVCLRDIKGRRRTKKCRNYNKTVGYEEAGYQRDTSYQVPPRQSCDCNKKPASMSLQQQYLQRQFLDTHLKKKNKEFEPRFIHKRSAGIAAITDEEMRLKKLLIEQQLNFNKHKCRNHPNGTFTCDKDVMKNPDKWLKQMVKLDDMIEETRKWLRNLKKMRKNMKKQKKLWKGHRHRFESNESEYPIDRDQFYTNNIGEVPCNCDKDNQRKDEQFQIPPELSDLGNDVFDDNGAGRIDDVTINNNQQLWTVGGKKKRKDKDCDHSKLQCTIQDNDHWQTPPYWTYGPYCYCTNANTNTYWCLRTINETHNFLYCEFINSFLNYYDFLTDPHQLTNQIKSLNYGVMQQLHEELSELRRCDGPKQCNTNKPDKHHSIGHSEKRRRRRRRRKVTKQFRRSSKHNKHSM